MEVKRPLSRSVTLGQAGRFHIKWTSWNIPGGPLCLTMKPEPTPTLLAVDGVQSDVSVAGLSLLSAQWLKTRCIAARGFHKHRGLWFLYGWESKWMFAARADASCSLTSPGKDTWWSREATLLLLGSGSYGSWWTLRQPFIRCAIRCVTRSCYRDEVTMSN